MTLNEFKTTLDTLKSTPETGRKGHDLYWPGFALGALLGPIGIVIAIVIYMVKE